MGRVTTRPSHGPAIPGPYTRSIETLKGAEIIVEHLVKEKVPYVFGLCGHGILGFLDALYDRRDRIKAISVHHETAAALMADAWFRVRQEPIATFTSCGPGSANLPVGVASAYMDSSAFLAITGNVPTSQWNRGPFQESGRHFQGDFVNVLRPYVKRSFQPTRPDMLPLALRQAFDLMRNGRPGPVHLDVPLNVFVEKAAVSDSSPDGRRAAPPAGDPEVVRAATRLVAEARRPVVIAGHGVELSGAEQALRRFAESAVVPVATSPLGKGVIDARHRLSLGASGRNGTYLANAALRNADVILALGTRFDDRATSAWLPGFTYRIPPTRLIHVDIDAAEIGRNFPIEIGIVGDARLVLEQMLADGCAPATERSPWLTKIEEWRERWETLLAPDRVAESRPIHPARVLTEVRRAVPEEGIVLADVGVHHNWLVCDFPAFRSRSLLQSWGFASMGFAVAGSLGAKLAAPERPVLAVCGDGGFLMLPSVVATAVEYDIPVTWLVWNNLGFCSIRDQQLGYFGQSRELATSFLDSSGELFTPDFAALSRSLGGDGALVERPQDLGEQLRAALASGRPTVLDVRVDRGARPPATASWDLPPLPAPLPDFGWGEDGIDL
jgi:acetolactate synthase-1/2/3 large subunit